MQVIDNDIQAEGMVLPRTYELHGLNEGAVVEYVRGVQENLPRYQIARNKYLSGGYHHASRNAAEGFCIYNDIGIAVQDLRSRGLLGGDDRILIIDVDAHHGNGNAHVFLKDPGVEILDIYNGDIYPNLPTTKRRVDIGLPLPSGTSGPDYLAQLREGLGRLTGGARLAFVVAGTDVLASDPLGALGLSVEECAERDCLVFERLKQLDVPAVFLAGGGYGKQSADAMIAGLRACRDVARGQSPA